MMVIYDKGLDVMSRSVLTVSVGYLYSVSNPIPQSTYRVVTCNNPMLRSNGQQNISGINK